MHPGRGLFAGSWIYGENKAKFVYGPATRRKTEKNEDLFYGPVYGEVLFHERMSATRTSK